MTVRLIATLLLAAVLACRAPTEQLVQTSGIQCAHVSDERDFYQTDSQGHQIVAFQFCDPPFNTAQIFADLMAVKIP